MKRLGVLIAVAVVVMVGGFAFRDDHRAKSVAKQPAAVQAAPSFDKTRYSLTDPSSIWIVVNKRRPLQPADYVPAQLVVPNIPLRLDSSQEEMHVAAPMAPALEQMTAAAKQAGIQLKLSSGYRSYAFQTGLYNSYVNAQGQAAADLESARPGSSEHQTGLAADLEPVSRKCEVDACFATTPEGEWLAANAYRFGFIIRYPADKTAITGYEYEPWHVRYIGTALSQEMHRTHTETLEEFFKLPAAPNY